MAIKVEDLEIRYGEKIILRQVNMAIKPGEIVTIIGPNGSGKSTLIKAISRYLKPYGGRILLENRNVYSIHTKEIAKVMAVLPQHRGVPRDMTVDQLVSFGRYPHLRFGQRLGPKDKEIIDWAIKRTGLKNFRGRTIRTLSGGERQRAWLSMALAQESRILLLDEPTTYLDISYQLELLELIKELNRTLSLTVIMVLHDLNQAARYSDNIYVLQEGLVCHKGSPDSIINFELLKEVFGIQTNIYRDEINNCPYYIPEKIAEKR